MLLVLVEEVGELVFGVCRKQILRVEAQIGGVPYGNLGVKQLGGDLVNSAVVSVSAADVKTGWTQQCGSSERLGIQISLALLSGEDHSCDVVCFFMMGAPIRLVAQPQ